MMRRFPMLLSHLRKPRKAIVYPAIFEREKFVSRSIAGSAFAPSSNGHITTFNTIIVLPLPYTLSHSISEFIIMTSTTNMKQVTLSAVEQAEKTTAGDNQTQLELNRSPHVQAVIQADLSLVLYNVERPATNSPISKLFHKDQHLDNNAIKVPRDSLHRSPETIITYHDSNTSEESYEFSEHLVQCSEEFIVDGIYLALLWNELHIRSISA
jgi:hypothetical protein